ncbi:glycosyltransferase family 2 protein [Cupriavidus yeoncheonensis]|uniref:glycosyltransferase n=1 Tax=Cupriavidus yeoncheonensis TaxID=1462994 RepID=UPI001E34DFDD|nr:glycosyltransferase family 2 protein [Cupriavidus yeoncheonensis]
MIASLTLDRRPPRRSLDSYPPLTILIAAYNEEGSILDTLAGIERQNYPAPLQVIVINDGSRDRTASLVREAEARHAWLRLLDMPRNGGKARALNEGLKLASHDFVVTVDADSYLHRMALTSIVERYRQDPPGTRAVAGKILVRNSRKNWLTRCQEWDYFQGIAAIKRMQSLYHGTLVAQGAFSLYDRSALIEVGGWAECVGEDIVLTWALLKAGYRVGHCEDACIFTNVPENARQFVRQRQRWARGMMEAFRQHPDILLTPRMSTFFIYWNLFYPWLDLAFTLGFVPGMVLALFGCYWIAGPMTLALLPLAFLMSYLMFTIERKMFDDVGLKVRRNRRGLCMYMIFYSLLLQPASVLGYIDEIFKTRKTWGTK